jgi:hypothetical protein
MGKNPIIVKEQPNFYHDDTTDTTSSNCCFLWVALLPLAVLLSPSVWLLERLVVIRIGVATWDEQLQI